MTINRLSVSTPTRWSFLITGRQAQPLVRIRSMASRVEVSGVTLTGACCITSLTGNGASICSGW